MNRTEHVWRQDHNGFDVSDSYPTEELKVLLSPYNGTVCSKCSGIKDEGMLLCFNCAERCPDPDCRGDGSKAAYKEACPDCLNWMRGLDDGHERDGFFVYLLKSGYIGMTYDPSRRQKEHEIRQQTKRRVSNEINKRKDSDNPILDVDSYRNAAHSKSHAEYFDERDKSGFTRWDRYVSDYWKKRCYNGSKISWLSPLLDTRENAWLSEFALKFFKDNDKDRFRKILSYSSAPLIKIDKLRLSIDSSEGVVLCRIQWSLDDELNTRQIVSIGHFEVECKIGEDSDWSSVDGQVCADQMYLERDLKSALGRFWRVRAVNAVNEASIPGPWSVLKLSEFAVKRELGNLLEPPSFAVVSNDWPTGAVTLSWTKASGSLERYSVYRSCNGGEYVLVGETCGSLFRDRVDPIPGHVYQYRVHCSVFGFAGPKSPASKLVVPPREPGLVECSIELASVSEAVLFISPPSVTGWANLDRYDIEMWSNSSWSPFGSPVPFDDVRRKTVVPVTGISDYAFALRVRAVSEFGAGCWATVVMSGEDIALEKSRLRKGEVLGRQILIEDIEADMCFDGVVEGLQKYEAFVRIGQGDTNWNGVGLVHISEMLSEEDVLEIGQVVRVVVKRVDKTRRRIALSMRDVPWMTVTERYSVDDVVEGKVIRLEDYGAFVMLEPKIVGLVHISEMLSEEDVLEIGQVVRVVVKRVDKMRRRIALSMRDVPWMTVTERYSVDDVVEGKVIRLEDYGAFVMLEPKIVGLVHISCLSRKFVRNPRDVVSIGQRIKVRVLNLDVDRRRISLSYRDV